MTSEKRPGKGTFSRLGLPVAARYLRPLSRAAMLWIGLGVGLAIAIWGGLDLLWGSAGLLSGGPLSSAHATLEKDCATCHSAFAKVTDEACASCHEKLGASIGRYSFSAHYLYRSNDFERLVPSEHETACTGCHLEHGGRQASLSDVPDESCAICHDRSGFATDHPEFAFAADPEGDDDALAFAHGRHVRELMERRGLADLEQACLDCHRPDPSGRGFEPLDFDLDCDACHLEANIATPRLAVASGPEEVGVETLETIQASGQPGTDWSFYLDPNEFQLVGGGRLVMKSPLHHRDPWVLHNLRRLRRIVYPDAGLADLLTASAKLSPEHPTELYAEALDTLALQARGLRGTADPEAQSQLDQIDALIARARASLDDPTTPFDPTEILLALEQPAELDPAIREEIDLLAADLTTPCTVCHRLDRLTIERVEPSQKTLTRAEFDHKAHVIQRRCLDCHAELPILEALSGETIEPSRDRSAIYNLPKIEVCRECHQPGLTSARCMTCHLFHPDAGRRSDLLLYQN